MRGEADYLDKYCYDWFVDWNHGKFPPGLPPFATNEDEKEDPYGLDSMTRRPNARLREELCRFESWCTSIFQLDRSANYKAVQAPTMDSAIKNAKLYLGFCVCFGEITLSELSIMEYTKPCALACFVAYLLSREVSHAVFYEEDANATKHPLLNAESVEIRHAVRCRRKGRQKASGEKVKSAGASPFLQFRHTCSPAYMK